MIEYTVHPAADLFPMIKAEKLNEIAADIKAHGLNESIKVCNGKILDGRNRLEACRLANVQPIFEEIEVDDPIAYVCSANIHRRHLTTGQRAAIAAELANLERGTNRFGKKVEGSNDPSTSGTSIDEAAAMLNVSPKSVKRAKQTMRDDPKAHEAAKAGKKGTRFSWVRIAEGHGIVSGTDGRSRNAAKADIERIDPTAIEDKDADRVDAACLRIKAERNPGQVRKEVESKKETLSQAKQREFDKLVRQKHAQLQAEAQKAVREVSEQLLAERDEWANTQWRKMQEEKRRLEGMRTRVERREKAANFFMSYSEWKLLELLSHEDKWPQLDRSRPEDAKRIDQLSRAFAIVQRMKESVDPNTPIATLRDQGWEPVAPAWKRAPKSQEARQ